MKTSEILDYYEHDFHSLMDNDDKIVWTGEPVSKFEFPLFSLDKDGFQGPSSMSAGPGTVVAVWLTILSIYAYVQYQAGNYVMVALIILFTIFVMMIPNMLMSMRGKRTSYAVTKKGILFKLWWYGKTTYEKVDWADVTQIQVATTGKDLGTIHFMCNENVRFFTYDFVKAKKRFNPTFENVRNPEELGVILDRVRREANLATR